MVLSDIPFTAYGIREGFSVMVSVDMIYIPEADVFINLANSRKCDLSLDTLEGLLIPGNLAVKVDILKELILEKGNKEDLSTLITGLHNNPFADLVRRRLPLLQKAFREGTPSAIEQAASLAGCGIGLTPSSDDLLIGSMSVYLADSKAKGGCCKEACKLTATLGRIAAKHTNTISGAFLEQCGKGLLSSDMKKLMYALYSNTEAGTVRQLGQRIQSIGSTSGTDMLTGVVLAVVNLNDGL
jgi:hypothetical protein